MFNYFSNPVFCFAVKNKNKKQKKTAKENQNHSTLIFCLWLERCTSSTSIDGIECRIGISCDERVPKSATPDVQCLIQLTCIIYSYRS